MTPWSIRRAGVADAEALAVLGERTFRDAFGPANTPSNTDQYVRGAYGVAIQSAQLTDPSIHTLVAVDAEGGLSGYAQVRVGAGNPDGVHGEACELWRFYVDRPWHGQGLATQVMSAVRGLARELGCDAIWLAVWEHNPRAIAFYTREGFRRIGSQPFQLGDDLQTDLVMCTSLDPSED